MKKIFAFFFICLTFPLFEYMDENFLRTDLFHVKEVNLEGDIEVIYKELETGVAHFKGKPIWDIDVKKIESIIERDIRIEKALVEKQIPNKLNIKIIAKKPEYYILYENNLYSLDGEKNVFSYLKEFPLKDYPVLSIKNMSEIEELIKILERIKGKQFVYLVSQLYIVDENCIQMILLDGTVIKTKLDIPGEKYDLLERLYFKLKNDGKSLEYIDIRFADYIVK